MIIYASLGENCVSQYIINSLELNALNTPFSWSFSNIDVINHLMDVGLDNILDKDMFVYSNVINAMGYLYENPAKFKYHEWVETFGWPHHDPFNIDEDYNKQYRRIERFKSLKNESDLIFIYNSDTQIAESPDIGYIIEKLNIFIDKHFPNAHVMLINRFNIDEESFVFHGLKGKVFHFDISAPGLKELYDYSHHNLQKKISDNIGIYSKIVDICSSFLLNPARLSN